VQDLRRTFEGLDLNALRMIVYAVVLIALMIVRPEGLLGERELFGKKPPRKPPGNPGKPALPKDAPAEAPGTVEA
jgi:branched-chain amino acid transport system permease protein